MTFSPVPYAVDLEAVRFGAEEAENEFSLALRAGRVVATVVSRRSGKHVTVQLRAKRKSGRRFASCELNEAERIYLDVPGEGRSTEIGCLHLVGKWRGKILPPWEGTLDDARLWAARRVLDVAHGRASVADEQAEILEGKLCLMCGRELTDPESIERNIGPECWRKATGLSAAHGEHQRPGESIPGLEDETPEGNAEDGAMGIPPTEADVIANDARHAEIEKIAVEELDLRPGAEAMEEHERFEEAEKIYEDRRKRGEVEDPAEFAAKVVAGGDQKAHEERAREEIEAEIQQTIRTPEDGDGNGDLPVPAAAEDDQLILLRAEDDPREVRARLADAEGAQA